MEGADHLGLKGQVIEKASTDDVRAELAKGHKLIAHVDPNFDNGPAQHFVVVTGMDGDQVTINDPLDNQPKTMSVDEFEAGTAQGAGVLSFAP